jgi:hypothetical protein
MNTERQKKQKQPRLDNFILVPRKGLTNGEEDADTSKNKRKQVKSCGGGRGRLGGGGGGGWWWW